MKCLQSSEGQSNSFKMTGLWCTRRSITGIFMRKAGVYGGRLLRKHPIQKEDIPLTGFQKQQQWHEEEETGGLMRQRGWVERTPDSKQNQQAAQRVWGNRSYVDSLGSEPRTHKVNIWLMPDRRDTNSCILEETTMKGCSGQKKENERRRKKGKDGNTEGCINEWGALTQETLENRWKGWRH